MVTKFTRQPMDYLLTETLPLEKAGYFTFSGLYSFLTDADNKSLIAQYGREYQEEINVLKTNEKLGNIWVTSPMQVKTRLRDGFRIISIISPVSAIDAMFFNAAFGNEMLSIIKENRGFGARIPYKTSALRYKNSENQVVTYSDSQEKQQLLFSLESSGRFYQHLPVKSLPAFTDSTFYLRLRDRFTKMQSIDIENYFNSIYTHSFSWLISRNYVERMKFKNIPSVYNEIDLFLERINEKKTNGIVVGPEFSRLISEFLLSHIDALVREKLLAESIGRRDYEVVRIIDDIYFFSNEDTVISKITEIYKECLSQFQLKIGTKKVKIYDKYKSPVAWLSKTKKISDSMAELCKDGGRWGYKDYRMKVDELFDSSERSDVFRELSYLLSTLVTLTEREAKVEILENTVYIAFHLYSEYPSFVQCRKLIRILNIFEKIDSQKLKKVISSLLERFQNDLFKEYPTDWIELLLLTGNLGIELDVELYEDIKKRIEDEENAYLYAGWIIYVNKMGYVEEKEIYKKNVKKNIAKVSNEDKDIFKSDSAWWVILFVNCNFLDDKIKKAITKKLTDSKNYFSKKNEPKPNHKSNGEVKIKTSGKVKELVLRYLLEKDKESGKDRGFIEWGFSQEDYNKKFYYYTRDRTVFGNANELVSQFKLSY